MLTSDRIGVNTVADIGGGVTREILTGDRVGHDWYNDVLGVGREVLTGDRVGQTIYGDVISVVREVLLKDPPLRAAVVTREALVSMSNESLSVARTINGYRQSVAMLRPTTAVPSTVHSPRYAATLREQVTMHVSRSWARSTDYAATLRQQTVMHRITTAAPIMHSMTSVKTLTTLTALSRGIVYTPVSELRAKTEVQQVAQHRNVTPAPQVRTAITAATLVQQYIASRAQKVIVITTEAHVGEFVQQTVQATGRPAPHSEIDAAALSSMTVQRRDVVPPNSGENAMTLGQQVVQHRVPTPAHGPDWAATLGQQVVQVRDYSPQRSYDIVSGLVQLSAIHRDTYAPAYAMGRHARTLRQQIVQASGKVAPHSITRVGSLRLGFVLGRTVPAPWDVIDPAIGRHAATLVMQALQHRVTLPPDTISTQSRFVFNVVGQVTVGDAFPPPPYPVEPHETDVYSVTQQAAFADVDGWAPVSAVQAQQVVGHVALGDNQGWIDPTVPQSDLTAINVLEALAVGDTFPGSTVPQAVVSAASVVEALAVGDTSLPDPTIPQSVVQVAAVIESAAVGDAQFPNPLIPLSEARSSFVGAVLALGDASLTGRFGMSEIQAMNLAEFVVVTDRSLSGIPKRGGPRPVVSISMS